MSAERPGLLVFLMDFDAAAQAVPVLYGFTDAYS
jgi:hypothetical protein